MSLHNHWRNKQLGDNILFSEQICLNFLERHKDLTWTWAGPRTNFYNYGNFNEVGNAIAIVNTPFQVTPGEFVRQVNELIKDKVAVYLAINRFEFIPKNDLGIDYADNIADSIDQIVSHLDLPFTRIPVDVEVDGAHFVGVHGLDIFTYD
jgi:hypothetical protein